MFRVLLVVAVLVFLLTREAFPVRFKSGINLGLAWQMTRALPLIEQAHQDVGIARGAVITSGTEGRHGVGSLHKVGLAVDLRTRDLSQPQIIRLVAALKLRLNGNSANNRPYQVVIEGDHLHIEYQP